MGIRTRKWQAASVATLLVCSAVGGCRQGDSASEGQPAGNVVTTEIQAGIEKHIAEQTRTGGGYFRLSHDGRELSLKLVRVHTEYLANLGPGRHFACVDLADVSGDVYDVDFFLAGEPGSMRVTETMVHKLNGKPFYAWEQKPDKTWHRVPFEGASNELLGVITGQDEFEFTYRATLPEITGEGRMWIPLASTDAYQTVDILSIDAPEHQTLRDGEYGNRILFAQLSDADSGRPVEIRYRVRRLEKAPYPAPPDKAARHLRPERLVPVNDTFRALAEPVVAGKNTDLVRARALYDHVIDRMAYIKYGSGWGKGDAVYACNARTGNCTDFHAYFIGLARAAGLPARFAIGAAIPSNRDDGGVDGYHCWAEVYDRDEGKWWPVDISEADKYSPLATYYFGHHPANRVEFSRGRDLKVDPGPASGPINFLAYPVLEVGGKPARAKVRFSFKRTARAFATAD